MLKELSVKGFNKVLFDSVLFTNLPQIRRLQSSILARLKSLNMLITNGASE
jgi:hypothetical protein